MNITIIGVPVYYGCDNPGAEQAPGRLRSMGIVEQLERYGHIVTDKGDVNIEEVSDNEKFADDVKMKYLGPITQMTEELSTKVSSALRDGEFPLVIGGDHSDGIGIISGVSRIFGSDTAVLWVDSHSDIHQFSTSPSGNIHGIPLGAAIGLDCGRLSAFFEKNNCIKGGNLFILGLRSFEDEELEIMNRFNVNHYSVKDFRDKGQLRIFADIRQKLRASNASTLHVSFDVDSLDPSVAPGTGIRVPDGFTEEEITDIVIQAFNTGMVRSMDISELNPLKDIDDMTSKLVLRVIDRIMK